MKLTKTALRNLILEAAKPKEIKPSEIKKVVKEKLKKEGGAAGMDLLIKAVKSLETKTKKLPSSLSTSKKIKKCIMDMDFIVKHRDGDIILTIGLPKK